ncbi:HAD family hydrolase [Paenibacillus flagellatus]|uniref:HAD family hydrolase n=1 Tax=Paenibacillus flagellatus TaxID=2211139 RepID=A0A2V5KRX7_9BACL|nr:HAD family hydrolase [Paenibacillus flagellatus]PYI54247.1 HAD family hydrolase [Paenibacillus flagellatus]
MNVTTILFDFDGTLADTLPICIHAIGDSFLKFDGKTLTGSDVVALFGPTEADIIRRHLANREAAEEAVRHFYDIYTREHDRMVRPDSNIVTMLDRLKERGYRLGIVTGKGRDALDISLDRLGMAHYFDTTVSGDEMKRPKPDPEGVLTAMNALGATADGTVFVGDSEADMRAGKGAGVFTIGAHWLANVQTHTFDTTPDLYVTHTEQLLAQLDRWAGRGGAE